MKKGGAVGTKRFAELYPGESPEATEARLEAAAWCLHLDGCAAAREHLTGRDQAAAAPGMRLEEDETGRFVRLDAGTDDESVVRSESDLDRHLRELPETVMVRRDGWTLPERDGRVEPDRACLLLSGNGPTVQVTAEIGMDGQLVNGVLIYVDPTGREYRFRADDHAMSGAGVEEFANVHRLPGRRA